MAFIKPVEYKNDSSTAGFAVAGDNVEITKQNVDTIDKDNQEGNLEPLDNKQTRYIEKFSDYDNTDYDNSDSSEEDLDSVEGENEGQEESQKESSKQGAAVGATLGSTAALMFGAAILTSTGNLQNAMNAFTAPVVGGIDVAASALGLAGAIAFDKDYNERLAQANNAGEQINAINQYYATLTQDIQALSGSGEGDNTTYEITPAEDENAENTEGETQDIISILAGLYSQLDKSTKEKDQAKVTEIQQKINQIETDILAKATGAEASEEAEGTESAEGAEEVEGNGETTQGPAAAEGENGGLLEHFASNNSAAHEIFNTSTNVASFLREGSSLGALGIMNTAALAGCAAISGVLAARAFTGVTIFTLANAAVGAALCGAAAGIFSGAAVTMGVKAAKEIDAGNKGNNVFSAANSLQEPLNEHDSVVEELQGMQETTETETTEAAGETSTPGATEAAAIAGSVTGGTTTTSNSGSGGSSGSSTSGSAAA